MTEIKFITEPDETGLGRIVVDGKFYGVPATALAILAIERERNRAAIAELVGALEMYMEVGDQCSRSYLARCHSAARAAITKHTTTTKEGN